MGIDDISNTGLGLGLGLSPHNGSENYCMKSDDRRKGEIQNKKKNDPSKCNKTYPSLSLGPIDHEDETNNNNVIRPASKTETSSPSEVSSFSNSSSIKRERHQSLGEEFEVEVENVQSKVQGVDEDGNPRKKLRLTKDQSAVLEEHFRENSTLNPKQKQELARKLNLRARQVEVWFQNRRARTKVKQTESDRELMKKYCETLTEENKRLQKEVQELKAMQTTEAPFHMQIPSATLTLCPSCEKICGGNTTNGSSPITTLLIGSKAHQHHFYKNNYPFTHSSSAAC